MVPVTCLYQLLPQTYVIKCHPGVNWCVCGMGWLQRLQTCKLFSTVVSSALYSVCFTTSL